MPTYEQIHQNHFYWRAGFGPTPNMLFQSGPFKPATYFDAYLKASEKEPDPFRVSRNVVEGLGNGIKTFGQLEQRSEEEKKQMRQEMQKQSREDLRNLNLLWLEEMVQSPAQLREKMSLFWHGHFACRNLNSFYQQQLLTTIRENALGNFGEMLFAVSQSAAMLAFLNNQQNRKQSPNENFAREVMELFTIGRGNYTETDIKEAARAFTGWGFNLNGEFVFRKQAHDAGAKTIFGKTGRFGGEDVLNMLLEKKQTAQFVTRKLYKYLVHEEADDDKANWLAERFYQSGYDIKALLRDVFTADWFYAKENIGARIKSPVELWVGIRRIMPVDLANPEIQMLIQRALGQILLYPPSVAGWPGGKNWIDSSSLLMRMRLPQLVAYSEAFEVNTKNDDDVNMGRMNDAKNLPDSFKLKGDVDWQALTSAFSQIPPAKLPDTIYRSLLQSKKLPPITSSNSKDANNRIIELSLCAMTTPEYQLC